MNVYLYELENLTDILDDLIFEEEPPFFNQTTALEFLESALLLIDIYVNDNPTIITEPDFFETIQEEIEELFYLQFEDQINNENVADEFDELLEEAIHIYVTSFYSERSLQLSEINESLKTDEDINEIEEQINYLRSKPQPEQRTEDWYKFRHNLITASNAYKAFESQATQNQLIYEKCQPLKTNDDSKSVNINTTFHWGQKYEPVSVLMYEHLYNTTVEDFGCIQHDTYSFIGASPDGINIDQKNENLYGRMLEIKNIVNREITGIPKKEYWIQTQLQMEVCKLDECDFLETKFVEYENANDFYNDGTSLKTVKDEFKGMILYFGTNKGNPFYLYKPIEMTDYEEISKWEEEMMDLYQSSTHNMIWIKTIYWKLEKLSCVLILRNQKWFQDNIGQIGKIWDTIEKERLSGYEHRAPNRKTKKPTIDLNNQPDIKCFLIKKSI
jgi:putative phage-type endonuclease